MFGYTQGAIIENVVLENIDITGRNYTGGLVGYALSSNTITNSYWDKDTTGQTNSARGSGKSTEDMNKKDTYKGWNFDTIWTIDEGVSYPTLR